jgi:hypothetical protein
VFEIEYVLIGRPLEEMPTTILTDVVVADGKIQENFNYSLEGSPYSNALSGKRVCTHANNVSHEFPRDLLLTEMNVESYSDALILGKNNELIGIFALYSSIRRASSEFITSQYLSILAASSKLAALSFSTFLTTSSS